MLHTFYFARLRKRVAALPASQQAWANAMIDDAQGSCDDLIAAQGINPNTIMQIMQMVLAIMAMIQQMFPPTPTT